ncbi:MAG: D-2-hydroxyacid dehydrogenase [Chloroflexi bacterium]|nr:D-2-hydroxyacid dehydrogenase [Chloroflexota bacterium]MDA1296886.1 D-2-hydroxyacid dehydrogenase [Chloroflexota bacterium]
MKVLVLPDWAAPFCRSLRERHPGTEIVLADSQAEASGHIREAEVLFGYPTSEQFNSASNLKWIQTLDAGMEGLFGAVPQVAGSQVTVTNARGAGAPMIGEHALALMLALSRQLPRFLQDKQSHAWDQEGALDVVEYLGDKTVGIVGLGKSGREIAWRCKAMGMRVLAVDREAIDADPLVEFVWSLDRLPDLLRESDYVVVTAPYSAANANLIGRRELATMKRSARLVVTSRGRVFDNQALASALKRGTIAGAALDTVEREPLSPDSELWDVPNLIITPHIAGNAEKIMLDRRTFAIFEENLGRYLGGMPLLNVVDKQKQY